MGQFARMMQFRYCPGPLGRVDKLRPLSGRVIPNAGPTQSVQSRRPDVVLVLLDREPRQKCSSLAENADGYHCAGNRVVKPWASYFRSRP